MRPRAGTPLSSPRAASCASGPTRRAIATLPPCRGRHRARRAASDAGMRVRAPPGTGACTSGPARPSTRTLPPCRGRHRACQARLGSLGARSPPPQGGNAHLRRDTGIDPHTSAAPNRARRAGSGCRAARSRPPQGGSAHLGPDTGVDPHTSAAPRATSCTSSRLRPSCTFPPTAGRQRASQRGSGVDLHASATRWADGTRGGRAHRPDRPRRQVRVHARARSAGRYLAPLLAPGLGAPAQGGRGWLRPRRGRAPGCASSRAGPVRRRAGSR
ncbi:hypothetical protein SAMN05216207_1004197 [Pseudonocardia ammonioxydans]|uniref:Uncharacterized protein n=1 Tax=Pseudonocardia ammonioxydans TaxID=260086 RepID=A0A1I4UNP6_PSUAM|nr:hypothetical protein SAMN05216207_1004197 [Pseudonocardia ammonioxydans]